MKYEETGILKEISGVKVRDVITYRSTGKTEVIEHGHNLVVQGILPVIMGLMKGEESYCIQYWAVGSGADTWDVKTPEPIASETKLTKEIGRKAVLKSNMKFADPVTYKDSVDPTRCIKITTTFYENDCNGTWREFGLFGGNATTEKDSGSMIDKKHHGIITKTTDMVIERQIYIILSL